MFSIVSSFINFDFVADDLAPKNRCTITLYRGMNFNCNNGIFQVSVQFIIGLFENSEFRQIDSSYFTRGSRMTTNLAESVRRSLSQSFIEDAKPFGFLHKSVKNFNEPVEECDSAWLEKGSQNKKEHHVFRRIM